MAGDPVADIGRELGVRPERLGALRQFDDAELVVLHRLVRQTFDRQEHAVNAGLTGAVRFVPRPLRGRVTTMLFPG